MGVVYLGRDITLDRVVALKTLPKLSSGAVTRLGVEARLMASVTHPNLATIFGIETWRRTPIIVVEYLEGGTLSARRDPAPSVDAVLKLGVSLASAVGALHAAGVLHRDIKPSNIGFTKSGAFTNSGTPKLLDFGLASLMDAGPASPDGGSEKAPTATQSAMIGGHVVAGTPLYLSPEAAAGAAPAPDFDLWSLAMVLYEAMAGRHPFQADTVDAVLRKVRDARVPDIRAIRSDCPEPVAVALTLMLSPERAQRPASAAAFRHTLERLVRA
jgi:serine/threonine protein kinase